MKPIPIRAAEKIAKDYGYDQVIIIARRVGEEPDPCGEHLTTYGINKTHCDVAARTGSFIQHKIMGWPWPKADRGRTALPGAQEAARLGQGTDEPARCRTAGDRGRAVKCSTRWRPR
jgi:hypothetical protein